MKNLKYALYVFLGGAMYGTMSSFVKLANRDGFNPAEIAFFQALLSAVILWTLALAKHKRQERAFGISQTLKTLLAGCAVGMVNLLYYRSLEYLSASLAVVVLMQFTWFTVILEAAVFGHKPTKAELAAVSVLLVGTFLASGALSGSAADISAKGVAIALAGTFSYAVYVVLNGHLESGRAQLKKSALIMSGSTVAIFAFGFADIVCNAKFSPSLVPWSLGFAVFGTAIPTVLFSVGIPKIGTCLSSILMTVELPVAVLCAGFILGENVQTAQVLGIFIMLLSMALINYYRHAKK